jgi:hypothetical protein
LSFAKQALAFFVKSGRGGPFFFVHWFWQSACSILFRSTRISSAVGYPQAMYLGRLRLLHVVLLDVLPRKVSEDSLFHDGVHELERFGNELEKQGRVRVARTKRLPELLHEVEDVRDRFPRIDRAVLEPFLHLITVIVAATAFDCAVRNRARSRRWSRSSSWRGGDPIVDAPQQSEAQSQPNVLGLLGDAHPYHPVDVALGKIAQGPTLVLTERHGV